MSNEWAHRFRQFALAVDYIDDNVIDDIKELLHRYFEETMEASCFRFLVEGAGTETADGVQPTLETVWASSDEKVGDIAVFSSDGRSSGPIALCFEKRKPLWITASNGGLLAEAGDDLEDGWSHMKLPRYVERGESSARTSVMIPLRYGERMFGVMNLEFAELVPVCGKAKEVIRLTADAIGRIIWVHRSTERQREDTREAFWQLAEAYQKGPSPLQRHSVFVASSARADQEVMNVILEVLREFENLFEVNYWRAEMGTGNIAEQVREAIAEADFGICYVSEPAQDEESKYRFIDNPNVLFEAGMLQMLHELRDDRSEPISRWIPIREKPEVASAVPFDFAGDRIIMVPRTDGTGPLVESELREALRTTVNELVESLRIH